MSKPALNAWQGRENALWRGVLEAGQSMRALVNGVPSRQKTVGFGFGTLGVLCTECVKLMRSSVSV